MVAPDTRSATFFPSVSCFQNSQGNLYWSLLLLVEPKTLWAIDNICQQEQAGAELCKAQVKLGLPKPYLPSKKLVWLPEVFFQI